jgi:hypothetical protein
MVCSTGFPRFTGPVASIIEHGDQDAHEIVDVAEAAGLAAVIVDRERLAREGLGGEVGEDPPITLSKARSIGVEDARDPDFDPSCSVVGHRERLGEPLRLVVDAARADGVDVAPVALCLGMFESVVVDFARRGEEEASTALSGGPESCLGPPAADRERLERAAQVIRRRSGAREVCHGIDVPAHLQAFGYV